MPALTATTVVARDFLITGLRLMASAKGRIQQAEKPGQTKDVMANRYHHLLFSHAAIDCGTLSRDEERLTGGCGRRGEPVPF